MSAVNIDLQSIITRYAPDLPLLRVLTLARAVQRETIRSTRRVRVDDRFGDGITSLSEGGDLIRWWGRRPDDRRRWYVTEDLSGFVIDDFGTLVPVPFSTPA